MNYSILVNKDHRLNSLFVPDDLIEIKGITTIKIDPNEKNMINKEALLYFCLLQNEAFLNGFEIFIDSAYRSYQYQEKLLQSFVAKYKDEAYKICALPGASEHQTGLAIDILVRRNNLIVDEVKKDDPEIEWLMKNCYRFGYILRYPSDKEHLTGFKFEPWHYRYVGKNLALELTISNNTLEEYYAKNLIRVKK
ncbi:MAG: D-alanyl-D-alanine carboxypeptidase family protein [Firmicutes bacterium]|nr:D-alanyl-D-alanine carboxypeptidase family protein [Bacillota bacterium]